MEIKLLIICYVPELAYGNNMANIANKIQNSFYSCSRKYNTNIICEKILQRNRNLVIMKLNELANYLEHNDRRAIIYYYGHGDQIRDTNGDEKDGKDEIWQTQGIIDDEISKIFNKIHKTSYLWLFSDSCSSGSMIDIYYNKQNWITISSANDVQDSLATADGGIFTMFGLLPSLENVKEHTANNIYKFICANIDIPTQKSILNCGGNKDMLNKNIFI